MVSRRRVASIAAIALVSAACAGSTAGDPAGERPYLVAVDDLGEPLDATVSGTLVVERDCVLLEAEDGSLVLPLFTAEPTRFGPRDGGALTIDTGGERLRVGEERRFRGRTGEVTGGLRSRYPGVDTTRCGVRTYALLGPVVP
jgi:hypothetical protein